MPFELIGVYLKLPVFLLTASRLGGILMFLPVFGGYAVPTNVRVLLVIGLAALITPLIEMDASATWHAVDLVLSMARELTLGILMGLIVQGCFVGLQLGGQLIAQESGLAFGQVADPTTDTEQSVISSLYIQLGAVVFLIVGGHRALIAAALESFRRIPLLGHAGSASGSVEMLLDVAAASGAMAIRVAAPALLTLFLINAAMGFISRTVPQFNILTIGFSVKGMIGFLMIAVALPAGLAAFTEVLELTMCWIGDLTGR